MIAIAMGIGFGVALKLSAKGLRASGYARRMLLWRVPMNQPKLSGVVVPVGGPLTDGDHVDTGDPPCSVLTGGEFMNLVGLHNLHPQIVDREPVRRFQSDLVREGVAC